MPKQLKGILITIGILLGGLIALMILDQYYEWAVAAIVLYTLGLIIFVFIAEIFLQIKYGGMGPISWFWVSLIRKDNNNLPEQKHPYIATVAFIILVVAFLIYIFYTKS
ncbi:MAG: hypothetical protein P4L74_00690 [Candidatus Doudnabacteria bacterium]|nr:hypothetical protein [Candidatus Doudnabacteria bacterium]